MKKITLFIAFISYLSVAAQTVAPTFSWTNKADFQINGETGVTFTPGQVATINISYTLGSDGGTTDAFNFIFIGLQDEETADKDVFDTDWANVNLVEGYPAANATGQTSVEITIPADAALSSSNTNLTYRLLTYLAYNRNGSTTYGGDGASDPTLVYIRSQAEINSLSTTDFERETKFTLYPNPVESSINFKGSDFPQQYKITNTLGKVVKQGEFKSSLNVSELSRGLYFIVYDNATFTKFLKK